MATRGGIANVHHTRIDHVLGSRKPVRCLLEGRGNDVSQAAALGDLVARLARVVKIETFLRDQNLRRRDASLPVPSVGGIEAGAALAAKTNHRLGLLE
eukprot:4488773-Prymnesium_polylepis.2